MVFLDERQVGFHTGILGFPSIDGCHALVLQTTAGLYGMHIVGGERGPKDADRGWETRAEGFANFVRDHFLTSEPVHLFGTCFRTTKRGYEDPQLDNWKKEMKAHAKALGYRGPISGFDLAKAQNWPNNDSAYVEYRKVFDKCYIAYKPWHQMNKTPGTSGGILDKVNRKTTSGSGQVGAIQYGKNHTIKCTSKGGTGEPVVVMEHDLDHFKR